MFGGSNMAVTFFFLPTIHICQHTFCVAHHRHCLRLSGLSDMDYDILDLDNVPPFNDKQWIKAGKQYPKNNTPYEVLCVEMANAITSRMPDAGCRNRHARLGCAQIVYGRLVFYIYALLLMHIMHFLIVFS